jgi:serine/threonine-protein kinase
VVARAAVPVGEAAAPPSRYVAGQLLANKYRLERPLGEGGQGTVWRATNLALDASVAVKLVRGEADDEDTARLLHEARVIARLGHPAVLRVYDVDRTADDDWFIVMELLEGETLRERLERTQRLAPVEVVRLLLPIADALATAHAHGVVHRDVKPDNIFLCGSSGSLRPKLLDFGTVKVAESGDFRYTTAAGTLVGTPGYLAPEQVLCRDDLDQRADVWGLCVTLYEAITGQPPFDGATLEALLRAVITDEVTPVEHFVPCDATLCAIIARGLAKHPDARWPSIEELGSRLARWLLEQGVIDDVCGVLLERRWFGASSEPTLAANAPASAGPTVIAAASRDKGTRSWSFGVAVASSALALFFGSAWALSSSRLARARSRTAAQPEQPARVVRDEGSPAKPRVATARTAEQRPLVEPHALEAAPSVDSKSVARVRAPAPEPVARPGVTSSRHASARSPSAPSAGPRRASAPVSASKAAKDLEDLIDPY